MSSARWRIGTFPPVVRRGLITLTAVVVLAAASATPVFARPPDGPSGQPDNDTYFPPRTPVEAALESRKLALAALIEMISPIGGAVPASGKTATALSGTDDTIVSPGNGSTGGSTGFTTPRNSKVLAVRARHQSTVYWCGPASGQVVINYSRGYVYDSLNGDNSSTNWKTQATLANWMNTTEALGTPGWRLTAALNRPDAVLKPFPEWSYVYGDNTDGADLNAKVVTDISQFAMPLVIAVKPHKTDAAYWLPSWPREAGNAKHWVVVFGYDGLWDGTQGLQLYYTESAGNGNKNPGVYTVDSDTMWNVNQYNASTIVW